MRDLSTHSRPTIAGPRNGFTLVELLVVIGIIALLAGILFPTISKIKIAGQEADSKNTLNQIDQACQNYYTDFHAYPGPVLEPDAGRGESDCFRDGLRRQHLCVKNRRWRCQWRRRRRYRDGDWPADHGSRESGSWPLRRVERRSDHAGQPATLLRPVRPRTGSGELQLGSPRRPKVAVPAEHQPLERQARKGGLCERGR